MGKVFTKITTELGETLDRHCGVGEYTVYCNLVWNKKTLGNESEITTFSVLSKPADEADLPLAIQQISDSLVADPLVSGLVLHRTVDILIANMFGQTNFKNKEVGGMISYQHDFKEVN